MRIDIDETYTIVLTEVYAPIILRTKEGNSISICMRDDTFEISMPGISKAEEWKTFRVQEGNIIQLYPTQKETDPEEKPNTDSSSEGTP